MISQDPIAGGIEITQEQYREALAGMTQGRLITIDGGFAVIDQPEPEDPDSLPDTPEPEPTLSELKDLKRASIHADCLIAIEGSFEYDGHFYDSDERSKSNIIGTATGVTAGVPLPEGFTWRTQDNQNIPMDGPAVIALGAALLQHISEQYAWSWQLKARIDAAESPHDLESISWNAPEDPEAA